jgi:hypothetical protein
VERFWPGIALEQEVTAARAMAMLCGGAMLAPLLAFGHGVEFLLAKLEITPDLVRVELTADCEGNYMLPDRESAIAAMNRLFEVAFRGREGEPEMIRTWSQVAALRFEDRQALDPTVPLPPDPTWMDRRHRLVTGIWEWAPMAGQSFRFQVPKGEPIDTLLWRGDGGAAEPSRPWRILISGDETEWFAPLTPGVSRWKSSWWWCFWAVAGLAAWMVMGRR